MFQFLIYYKICFALLLDLGHGRPGKISELGRCVLSWRRLLRTRLRRDHAQLVQEFGELARRISNTGVAARSRKLSIRSHWQQS